MNYKKIFNEVVISVKPNMNASKKGSYVGRGLIIPIICAFVAIILVNCGSIEPEEKSIKEKTICILDARGVVLRDADGSERYIYDDKYAWILEDDVDPNTSVAFLSSIVDGSVVVLDRDLEELEAEGLVLASDDEIEDIYGMEDEYDFPYLCIKLKPDVIKEEQAKAILIYINDDYGSVLVGSIESDGRDDTNGHFMYVEAMIDSVEVADKIAVAVKKNQENEKDWKKYLDY